MIRAREIADFIRAADLGIDTSGPVKGIAVVPDDNNPRGEIVSAPDRLVIVNLTGGAGTLRQRTFDRPTVQVMSRGLQNSDADAEDLAAAVDNLLMGVSGPLTIGARRVISIDYLGGPPTILTRDESHRATFACNYTLQVDREVY